MTQLFKNVVNDDDLIEVIEHLRDKAKESDDIQWTQLFLAYAMGKPPSSEEIPAGIVIEGDLALQLPALSTDQLRALKAIDVSYQSLNEYYDALPGAPAPDPAASSD